MEEFVLPSEAFKIRREEYHRRVVNHKNVGRLTLRSPPYLVHSEKSLESPTFGVDGK